MHAQGAHRETSPPPGWCNIGITLLQSTTYRHQYSDFSPRGNGAIAGYPPTCPQLIVIQILNPSPFFGTLLRPNFSVGGNGAIAGSLSE